MNKKETSHHRLTCLKTSLDKNRECLAPGEILIRICPSTKRPTLVCHEGEGNCLCLHNETPEEDICRVREWLEKEGNMPIHESKLLEVVADLSYNAGTSNLCDGKDSRIVIADLIHATRGLEARHKDTDWNNTDYLQAIDHHYREHFGQI